MLDLHSVEIAWHVRPHLACGICLGHSLPYVNRDPWAGDGSTRVDSRAARTVVRSAGMIDRDCITVECALDERTYETGIRIKISEMKRLDIEGDAFHPEWNYTIKPRRRHP